MFSAVQALGTCHAPPVVSFDSITPVDAIVFHHAETTLGRLTYFGSFGMHAHASLFTTAPSFWDTLFEICVQTVFVYSVVVLKQYRARPELRNMNSSNSKRHTWRGKPGIFELVLIETKNLFFPQFVMGG